jgi:hypothetical protein
VILTASRTLAATDPQGQWEVYPTYQDASGWHDGESVYFTVSATGVSVDAGTGSSGGGDAGSGGGGGTETGSGFGGSINTPTAGAPPAGANIMVDFTMAGAETSDMSVGSCISTYGGTNLIKGNSAAYAAQLKKLGPIAWRIPLYYDGSGVDSSAGGARNQGNVGGQYIQAIKNIGGIPMVVVGGSTNDNDIKSADAAKLVHYYNDNGGQNGGPVLHYVVGNEPDNQGMWPGPYLNGGSNGSDGLDAISKAMRGASTQQIYLAGPALAWLDQGKYDGTFFPWLQAHPGDLDVVDFHKYGHASSDNNPGNVGYTYEYTDNAKWMDSELQKFFSSSTKYGVQVGEFNFNPFGDSTWYQDFYTSRNLVHTASVYGHMMVAGGHAYNYSDSNGALGLLRDDGSNQPLPSYWGISAWTGGDFIPRRYGANMVATSTTLPDFEVYATDNQKKIILINKSDTSADTVVKTVQQDQNAVVHLNGVASGTYSAWIYNRGMDQTNTSGPQFQPPQQLVNGQAFSGNTISVTVPWMSVVVITVN